MIGGVHYWWPGSGNEYPPGNSTGPLDAIYVRGCARCRAPRRCAASACNLQPPAPLLPSCARAQGMSFVNIGVAAAFFNVLGSPGTAPEEAGLDVARLDATLDTQRRLGSFVWLTDDPLAAALMPTTHINASTHTDPARAVIGKGLGWELAAAAYRGRWARVTTLVRWLGAAAGNLTLFGESYSYDCLRTHTPTGCWGDLGNGEQTGWFLWGVAVARRLAAAALAGEAARSD
jgi:hypothetical protein